jgi:hypothetical protein
MASTISTTTTITVAIMLLLTTHPLTWLGSWQAPLGRAAVSPHYQVDKHYDDYDNYSGYSETDGVSRHPYLLPSLLSAENAPTNTQNSAKAGTPEGYPGPVAVLLVFVYGPPDQLMLCGFQVFPL